MAKGKWIFGAPHPQAPQDISKPLPTPVLASADAKKFGLENFGHTCYANSVLQALYFCTPFRDLLLQSEDHSLSQRLVLPLTPSKALQLSTPPAVPTRPKSDRKTSSSFIPSVDPSPPNGAPAQPVVAPIPSSPPSLFSALRSLFFHISTHPAEKGTVAPRAFIDKLKEVNELFRSTMHQDAHEFLNYLLNKIVEEVEERKHLQNGGPVEDLANSLVTLASKAPTAATSSNSGHSAQDATLVHKLFEGVLTSETRCLTCETVSSRDESFLDLSIDIEQNSSVTACLRQFSASEMLCQKNKFFCDSCCDLQEAEKRMKIKKLPNVLALHLKRFKYQEDVQKYIKLAYRVAFPFELRLFNTVDEMDDADRLYNLFGIVVHIGNGPHHGHYISIIKTLGTWLVFDDDNVYPLPECDIPKYFGDSNAGSAYVLYYQAADIDLAGLGLRPTPSTPPSADIAHTVTTSISASGPLLPHSRLTPPLVASPQPMSEQDYIHDPSIPQRPPTSTPIHPSGLVAEEGDSSDFSDPPFPATPSTCSASTSLPNHQHDHTNVKPRVLPSEPDSSNGTDVPSPSLTPSSLAQPAGGKVSGLLKTIRKTPSMSVRTSLKPTRTSLNRDRNNQNDAVGPESRGSMTIPSPPTARRPSTAVTPSLPSSSVAAVTTSRPVTAGIISSPALVDSTGNREDGEAAGSGDGESRGIGNERRADGERGKEKEREKERDQTPEWKASTWFRKRKSFKIGDKSKSDSMAATIDLPPSPALPYGQGATRGGDDTQGRRPNTASSSSSPSLSPAWFKTSGQPLQDRNQRRPSKPESPEDLHTASPAQAQPSPAPTPAPYSPSDMSINSPGSNTPGVAKLERERDHRRPRHRHNHSRHQSNGYAEIHSLGSVSDSSSPVYTSLSIPPPSPAILQAPISSPLPAIPTIPGDLHRRAARTSSLTPVLPDRQEQASPERKKSMSSFPSLRDKEKQAAGRRTLPSLVAVPRSSMGGATSKATSASGLNGERSLPPVPPLPVVHPQHGNGFGFMFVDEPHSTLDNREKGSMEGKRNSGEMETNGTRQKRSDARPLSSHTPSSHVPSISSPMGLGSFSIANHSSSTASSNLKRATRKLSLTAPMLGFGKKDKDKDRQRERDKAAPSSFARF